MACQLNSNLIVTYDKGVITINNILPRLKHYLPEDPTNNPFELPEQSNEIAKIGNLMPGGLIDSTFL